MALPGVAGCSVAAGSVSSRVDTHAAASSYDDLCKKIRKPYTISKSRESWTEQEHDHFLEALHLFDRDWKKVESFVASKTVIQIRSHAQKYFLKVQKKGTGEHVPPPRPKRKAAHPYPQKASKNGSISSQAANSVEESLRLLEQGNTVMRDTSSAVRNCNTDTILSSCAYSCIPSVTASQLTKDVAAFVASMVSSCSSARMESPNGTQLTSEILDQEDHIPSLRGLPDFTGVYSFLGSVFDPSTSGHLEKLKEMDPIDVETVLQLMKNLAVNLTSSEFKSHVKRNMQLTKLLHLLPTYPSSPSLILAMLWKPLLPSTGCISNLDDVLPLAKPLQRAWRLSDESRAKGAGSVFMRVAWWRDEVFLHRPAEGCMATGCFPA